jgi:homoserine O-acetyltransferase/O-succinyltransferase
MTTPRRQTRTVPRFMLESGQVLKRVDQAFTWTGRLNAARDNVILVFHSLTGDADPLTWWPAIVGPGRALDTNRYAVLCPNLLGSCYGTTAPPAGAVITTRDMARFVRLLVDELGISGIRLATGGSLGGMVALEWAATCPSGAHAVVVLAAPAAHPAHAVGYNHVQRRAIELAGAPGLELARMIAMLTYRTPVELQDRFGRDRTLDRYRVQSYLDHQGEKLRRRFDPAAYLRLIDSMDAHDVGRGRGGVAAALAAFEGFLVGVGIPGDLLYPAADIRGWTEAAGCAYTEIASVHGHDAFLLEPAQTAAILTRALAAAAPSPALSPVSS